MARPEIFYSGFPDESPLKDVVSYEAVHRRGWKSFLDQRECVVMGLPWGRWAPFIRKDPGANLPKPLKSGGFGALGDIDPALSLHPDVWEWAARPTSTLLWLLTSPWEVHGRIPHGILGMLLFHRVIQCRMPGAVMAEFAREDLRDVGPENSGWVESIGGLSPMVFFEPGAPFPEPPAELEKRELAWEFNPPLVAFDGGLGLLPAFPPMPGKIENLSPIGHPRGIRTIGLALAGTVGEGRIVFLYTRPLAKAIDVARLRKAAAHLHAILHHEPDPHLTTSLPGMLPGSTPLAATSPSRGLEAAANAAEAGSSMELKEIVAILSKAGYDGKTWTADAVRKRMIRDQDGLFAALRTCRPMKRWGKYNGHRVYAALHPYLQVTKDYWDSAIATYREIHEAKSSRERFENKSK